MKGFLKKSEGERRAVHFLKALAAAYALTAVIFMILAIALAYTDMSEGYIPLVSSAASAGACFLGGIISGKGIKTKGLFCIFIVGRAHRESYQGFVCMEPGVPASEVIDLKLLHRRDDIR